jgi:hypothetical protein
LIYRKFIVWVDDPKTSAECSVHGIIIRGPAVWERQRSDRFGTAILSDSEVARTAWQDHAQADSSVQWWWIIRTRSAFC